MTIKGKQKSIAASELEIDDRGIIRPIDANAFNSRHAIGADDAELLSWFRQLLAAKEIWAGKPVLGDATNAVDTKAVEAKAVEAKAVEAKITDEEMPASRAAPASRTK